MISLFYILILLVGFLVGYSLAYLCKDELVKGRKWFFILSGVCLASAVVISFIPFLIFVYKFPVILTLFFIIIISLIAIWKSYDKNWIR